eukprot:scaffold85816_cov19-Tisochrysis_lutea.AAC.1
MSMGKRNKEGRVAPYKHFLCVLCSGLQINRWSAPESTVEGTLEVALLRAGLIAPSNYVSARPD